MSWATSQPATHTQTAMSSARARGTAAVLGLGLVLGLLAAPTAAAMAFLITYEEYRQHGFGRRELLRHCLRVAVVAFAFAVGSVVVAWLLARLLGAG